jgi:hypothetical protein
VAFINNYSTLSEERHKKILNILSNTVQTNRNALVPVQFSANCAQIVNITHRRFEQVLCNLGRVEKTEKLIIYFNKLN